MNKNELLHLTGLCIWGYVLITISIQLGPLDILPGWLGCLLFYRFAAGLGSYEPSVLSLKPLLLLLTALAGVAWFLPLLGLQADWYPLHLLTVILNLYVHFQLLTGLASLARGLAFPKAAGFLSLRNARTVIVTLGELISLWEGLPILPYLMLLPVLFLFAWTFLSLFSLRSFIKTLPDS